MNLTLSIYADRPFNIVGTYISINLIEICIKKRIETIQKRLSAYKATQFYKYLMTK